MSQLPLSLGGFHSSATLKPQMSTIFRDSGGPGRSAQWQKQQTTVCCYCRSHFSSCAGRPPRVTHLQPAAWHWQSPPRSQSAPAGRTSPSVFSRSCGWRGWCPRHCSSRWQTSCSEARPLCSMSPLAAVYPVWPQGQQVEAHEHSNQATTWRLLNAAKCTVNALPDCYHAGPIEKKAADHLQCWKPHLKRNHNVDCVSDFLDEGLAEVPRQPDFGSFFERKQREIETQKKNQN